MASLTVAREAPWRAVPSFRPLLECFDLESVERAGVHREAFA